MDKTFTAFLVDVVNWKCIQLPVRIAYAITIHKSQGHTYDNVNLMPECFAQGQLYVALSRTKNISGLHLIEKIQDSDLITSKLVLEFYEKLQYSSRKKERRGGSRIGSGRKSKYGIPTCTIRIPISLKDKVLKMIEEEIGNE